jgi:class 3 adenylate cyclase
MYFAASGISTNIPSRSRDVASCANSRPLIPIPRALQQQSQQSNHEQPTAQHRGVHAMFAKEGRWWNRRYKLPEMESMFMISFYEDRLSILACWSLALLVGLAMAVPSMRRSYATSTLALTTCGIACVIWFVVVVGTSLLRRELQRIERLATVREYHTASGGAARQHWWLAIKHEARKVVEMNAQRQEYLVAIALLTGLLYASYLFPARGINCDVAPNCSAFIDLDAVILFFLPLPLFISPLRVSVLAPLFTLVYVGFFGTHFIPGPLAIDYKLLASFATVAIVAAALTVLTAYFNECWRREDFERMCLMQMDIHAMTVAREVVMSSVGYEIPLPIAKRVIGGQTIEETSLSGSVAMMTLRSTFTICFARGPGEMVQRFQKLALVLDEEKKHFPAIVKFPCRGDSYCVACGPFAEHLLPLEAEPASSDVVAIRERRSYLAFKLFEFIQASLRAVHESESLGPHNRSTDEETALALVPLSEDVVCAVDTGVLTCTYASHLSECLVIGEPMEMCRSLLRTESLRYRTEELRRTSHSSPTGSAADSPTSPHDAAIVASAAFHKALPPAVKKDFSEKGPRRTHNSPSQQHQQFVRTPLPGRVEFEEAFQSTPRITHDDETAPSEAPSVAFERETFVGLPPASANTKRAEPRHQQSTDESQHYSTGLYTPSSSSGSGHQQATFFCKRHVVIGQLLAPPLPSSPKSVLHGPPSWSGARRESLTKDTDRLLLDGSRNDAQPPHNAEGAAGGQRAVLERIEEDVRMTSSWFGSLTFCRTEMEEGYRCHLDELGSRGHTQWMFICCGVTTLTLIITDTIYRLAAATAGKGVALLGVAVLVAFIGGVLAMHYSHSEIPLVFTLLYMTCCGLWYGAFAMEGAGSLLHDEQLVWGLILLTVGLLREHVRAVLAMSAVDFIVCIPTVIFVLLGGRSMKTQAYLIVAQFIMWFICLVTRLLRDRTLRHQFAGRVLSLLCTSELESDYEIMEQLLVSMVPHRIASRLLHNLRTSLKRPTFIPSVYRLQGEDSAGTSQNASADDEVRNTLQASLQPHIATMFSTSTVDTPFAYVTWTVPRGASRPTGRHLLDDAAGADTARRSAQLLTRGRNAVQEILRHHNGAIAVMATGDSCLIVDETSSVFDQKLVNVFETVREVFLKFPSVQSTVDTECVPSYPHVIASNDLQLSCVLHTGPLMGAVVGKMALSYEYYGEAISTAKRLCYECVDRSSVVATERFTDVLRLSWQHMRRFPLLPGTTELDIAQISQADAALGATFSPSLSWALCGRPSPLLGRFVRFQRGRAESELRFGDQGRSMLCTSPAPSSSQRPDEARSGTPASTVPRIYQSTPESSRDPSGVVLRHIASTNTSD